MAFARVGALGTGFGRLGVKKRAGAGVAAEVGGAALLTGETAGFATDFTYATDASRVAVKETLGPELVVNGGFDSGASWTLGTDWSIAGGVATKVAGSTLSLSQLVTLAAGKTYKLVYTLTASAGLVTPYIFTPSVLGTARGVSNTYTEYLATGAGGQTAVGFSPNAAFAGTIDNVSLKEVGAGTATITSYGLDSFYSQAGTSPKMVYDVAGNLVWSPHNLFLNSGAPVTQTVTTTAVQYTVTVVGSGSLAVSGSGSGTATQAAPLTFTAVGSSCDFTKTGTLTQIQLNRGPVATAYLATTGSQRFGLAIDYNPVSHAAKGLLVEPAGTNLISWSNRLDVWTTGGMTAVLNAAGPLGANTAFTLTCNAGATGKWTYIDRIGGSAPFQHSIYAKAGTLSWISMGDASASAAHAAYFNVSAGTVGTVAGRFSAATIEPVGDGWFRCSAAVATGSAFFDVQPHSADNEAYNWTATGGETVFVSAAQAESGTVATSYIPTVSATVTRAADQPFFLLSAIPVISTEFTLYGRWQTNAPTSNRFAFCVTDNLGTPGDYAGLFASTSARLTVADGTVTQATIVAGTIVANTSLSIAGRSKLNDFSASMNGAAVVTDVSGTQPTGLTHVRFGNTGGNAAATAQFYVEKMVILPRGMSNAELVVRSAT